MTHMRDLIIIGAGPAGITAAVYAARKKIDFCVVTDDIGGQAGWSGGIENYTGYQFLTGPELVAKFEEHMRTYSIETREGERVTEVKKLGTFIRVTTTKGMYEARAVIVASGKRTKELGVPGEKEFRNKGLTYCATCDGPLFSGKDVVVVGGGNSALDAALQLERIARHVYVVNIAAALGGDPVMRDKVERSRAITVLNESRVTAVIGEKMVTALLIERRRKEERLAVEGVFVEIGLIPNSEFVSDVAKNTIGEIEVSHLNETSVQGIYAAGDVTDVPEKQIIIAAGEGSKAMLSVFRYLMRNSETVRK